MQTKRINPWPTSEQELERLALAVGGVVCGKLLWETLSAGQQERLGGDFEKAYVRYGRTVGMYRKLSGMPPRRAVLDVAMRIKLLEASDYARLAARCAESGTTFEARVRYAVRTHTMVLVPDQRVFYFDGTCVDLSTRPKEWAFIKLLANRAPNRRTVAAEEVSEGVQSGTYLRQMLSRMSLREGFPPGFVDFVKSRNRDGELYLDLDGDQICVIVRDD